MMNLPFLKKRKTPRTQEPMDDKMVGLSGDEQLEHQVTSEMMNAIHARDPKAFRASLEAHVMNQFDWSGDDDAA